MSTQTTVLPYHDTAFPLDGQAIRMRVARLTVGQAATFRRHYHAINDHASLRQVSVRAPGEEMETRPAVRPKSPAEQALVDALAALDALSPALELPNPTLLAVLLAARALAVAAPETDDVFVVDTETIQQRRLDEMSPAQRDAYDALVASEDAREAAFIEAVITEYVSIEPDQILVGSPDGPRSVTTGAEFLQLFGSRPDDMRNLVNLVRMENEFSESRKKIWRSLFGFGGSSAAPAKAVTGNAPAPIVDAAGTQVSAAPEAAMDVHVM